MDNTTMNTTIAMNNPFVKKHEAFHAMLNVTMQDAKEATKEDPAMPALMHVLLAAFEKHVDMLVETRFAALVESHKTLALMDENMRKAIAEMIDDRLDDHTNAHEHWTEEQLDNNTEAYLDSYMRNNDYITENQLAEKVGDVLDDVLSEKLESLLDGASVSISI